MQISSLNPLAASVLSDAKDAAPLAEDKQEARKHSLFILLFACIAHGLLLLNDGAYWDGWRLYHWVPEKNWAALSWHFHESNSPQMIPIHRMMGIFSDAVFGYKLVGFLSILCAALLVYKIGSEFGFLSRKSALCVALFALVFPANQTSVELCITPYNLCLAVYLWGVYLALRAENARTGRHLALRLCALVCFVAAFSTNSLLVFHFGFLWLLAAYLRKQQGLSQGQTFRTLLMRRMDYVLLPVLYWVISKAVVRNVENPLWIGYNHPSLNFRTLIYLVKALWASVYVHFNELFVGLLQQPIVWLLCLLFVYRLYSVRREGLASFFTPATSAKSVLTFGACLLGLGLFPYIAVGKPPSSVGWESRHALLVALPVALLVIGMLRLLFADTKGRLTQPGAMLLATLLCGGTLSTIQMYLLWQARWIKDRSIIVNLRRLPDAAKYSLYEIDDQFPVSNEPHYDIWEWAGIFKAAWGGESRAGLDKYSYMYDRAKDLQTGAYLYDKHLMLAEFDLNGLRARLRIQAGNTDSPENLCLHYFSHRFFRRGEVENFLSGVTRLEVQPIAQPSGSATAQK